MFRKLKSNLSRHDNEIVIACWALSNYKIATDQPIQDLHLSHLNISKKGVRALAELLKKDCCKNLRSLRLDGNKLDDEDIEIIMKAITEAQLTNLQFLILNSNIFKGKGMQAIADMLTHVKFKQRITLGLEYIEMDDNSIKPLVSSFTHEDFPENVLINLEDNKLTDASGLAICNVYNSNKSQLGLKLLLSGNPISDAMLERKERLYREKRHIVIPARTNEIELSVTTSPKTYLYLTRQGIEIDGARKLAEVLKLKCYLNIEELHLGCNNLGDEGVLSIMQASNASGLSAVKDLDLQRNNISNGAIAIFDALRENKLPCIKKINLSRNRLSNKTAIAAASALKSGRCNDQIHLSFTNSNISDRGVIAIIDALTHPNCPNTVTLGLENINITNKTLHKLIDVLRSGKCKTILVFIGKHTKRGNLDAKLLAELMELVKENCNKFRGIGSYYKDEEVKGYFSVNNMHRFYSTINISTSDSDSDAENLFDDSEENDSTNEDSQSMSFE